MNYGEILTNAWKTIWKHKVLWVFGILAGLASGGGGGGGAGGGGGGNNGDPSDFLSQNIPDWMLDIGLWVEQNWVLVLVAAALVVFILFFVVLVLSTFGRTGLVRGAWQADEGAQKLTFGALFAESGRYFWRVLGLAFLIFLVSFGVGIIITVFTAGFAIATLGIGLLCLIPFFCLLGIAGWIVEIIVRLGVIVIVGEDKGVFQGLQKAWETVRDHLGQSVVMGLILGFGGGIARLIVAVPFFFALIPMIPALMNGAEPAIWDGLKISALIACVYLPFAIVFGGIIEAYIGTAWTLTYRRMNNITLPVIETPPAS
jgi:ABC-type multidrug transport system fused ATPase/permease subunit